MAIVKQYQATTGTTYVYESVSYWDPEKKQPRSNRKLIGKLDPETGEIIPTGKVGRPKKAPVETVVDPAVEVAAEAAALADVRVKELTQTVAFRNTRIAELEKENSKLKEKLATFEQNLKQRLSECLELCSSVEG